MIPEGFHSSLFIFHILPIILVGFSLFQFIKILCELRRPKSTPAPPGSGGFPLIGETLSFLAANNSSKGFYDFIQARRARYGNCFRTNIFWKTHVFVSSTRAAKLILGNNAGEFKNTFIRSISELLGEQSILCALEDHHRIIRHCIGSLFTRETMTKFIGLFDSLTLQAQSDWRHKETVVVLDEALKITFRAICKMLMSLEKEDELEMLQNDIHLVCEAMLAIPLRFPWTRFFRGVQARKRIIKTVRKIINARREGVESHEDFLQALLVSDESSSDGHLTDEQIQVNILTLIIAGQITTSTSIAWMVKYLDENQEVQDKLRDMQLSVAAKTKGSVFGMETLNEMSYASKVVKETLRMSTIVSWFPMIALKDCEIEGFQIKRGWIVNVDARYIHNDQNIYENPAKFSPSRFDEDPKPYGFLAFGTGGRTCLGMNIAKAMMLIFLHHLVTTYRWKVIDPDQSLEKHALFPRLRSGCPIRVTPIVDNVAHSSSDA